MLPRHGNGGYRVDPEYVVKVEDHQGKLLWQPPRYPERTVDPGVSWIMTDMLREVVDRGTGYLARDPSVGGLSYEIPAAGKTGTTNDNADVWFVGMTPELVAGVWLGFDKPQTIAPGAAGGTLAAPIWGDMLAHWYQGRTPGAWTPPEGLVTAELDRDTGQPATPATPPERRYTEYFLPGTEPGAVKVTPWSIFASGPIVH